MVHFSAIGPAGIFEFNFISGGLKEGYDDNGGKHQTDDRGINDGDDFDGLTIFVIVEAQGLEDGRKAVAHVEPNDDKENQVRNGDIRNLEKCACLLIEIQVAVDPSEFDEKEMSEMQQQTCQKQNACPYLQLGACMGLGALGLVVAFGSCDLVGDGQPKGQDDVEQQGAK